MAIGGSADVQKRPNIIRRSLAPAYLLSTLNLFAHTPVFCGGEKNVVVVVEGGLHAVSARR